MMQIIIKQNDFQFQADLPPISRKIRSHIATLKVLNEQLINNATYSHKHGVTKIIHDCRTLIDLIDEMLSNYFEDGSTTSPIIFNLYKTTPNIKRLCINEPQPSLITKTDFIWLSEFEQTVFKSIAKQKINLIDLAYDLLISERQLHRNTNNLAGLTPNNYIRILKLHQAKEHLQNLSFKTLSEVSNAVGFRDTHYFSQIFIAQYGVSPKSVIPTSFIQKKLIL